LASPVIGTKRTGSTLRVSFLSKTVQRNEKLRVLEVIGTYD
jgi:hypothetical protein